MKELIALLITGIVCITVLECFALYQGMNGTAFGLAIAGIGTIIGAGLDHFMKKRKLMLEHDK